MQIKISMIRQSLAMMSIVLLVSSSAFSQSVKEQIRDGLKLSFYLGEGEFDRIEQFISDNNFLYKPDKSEPEFRVYTKWNNEFTTITMLIFDTSSDIFNVKIIHKADDEPFNFNKLQIFLNESDMFFQMKGSEDGYIFDIPKKEGKENGNEFEDMSEYVSTLHLNSNKDMVTFFTPMYHNDIYLWDKVFDILFSK